jgi:hypothetical protein
MAFGVACMAAGTVGAAGAISPRGDRELATGTRVLSSWGEARCERGGPKSRPCTGWVRLDAADANPATGQEDDVRPYHGYAPGIDVGDRLTVTYVRDDRVAVVELGGLPGGLAPGLLALLGGVMLAAGGWFWRGETVQGSA